MHNRNNKIEEEPTAMDIHFYADDRGRQAVYEWAEKIKKKDKTTYNRFYYLLTVLSENGEKIHSGELSNDSIKKLKGTDIWQIRVNDNRILFFYFSANTIVLTNQFPKKQNNTPKNEITKAEDRMKNWINKHS
uniref:type II toxin-antitoxin system RelE/ParE family toxin n=1 Tax=Bacillus sp. JAMB750 TaxID=253629 RepID=UPI00159EC71E|nr:type II toxin-antitoxin system RelE/ParE family toxin [Bacillus sp. JAMB750]